MATQVHMIYTGIIAVVPDPTYSGKMHLCIPENPEGTKEDCLHVPHVMVEDYESSPTRDTDLEKLACKDLKERDGLAVYAISGYQMTIQSVVRSPLITDPRHIFDFAGASYPPSDCDRFNTNLLGKFGQGPVTTCTCLADGRLEASYVDPYTFWQFAAKISDHKVLKHGNEKRLAQEIVHSFAIEGDVLELSFEGKQGHKALKVGKPPKQATIEVRIGNTLCEDVFPSQGDSPEEDHHVKMYHALSRTPAPAGQRLILVSSQGPPLPDPPQSIHNYRLAGTTLAGSSAEAQILTVGGANCPPGRFRT